MEENNIIVQVDEATKGIMESITSELTTEISEPLLKLSSDVSGISDTADELLRQVRTANSTSAQIKGQVSDAAEKSDELYHKVTQLSESVATINEKLDSLVDIITEFLSEKHATDVEIEKIKRALNRRRI